MKIATLLIILSLSGLSACSSYHPKGSGWGDVDNQVEKPVNQNLTELQNQINNKNVWSN